MKLIALLALLLPIFASAEIIRNPAAVREFRRNNICPSTQAYSAKCPGYVVDHIVPLCAGGADLPNNMQYQTKEAGLQKDKLEWYVCRKLKQCMR